jgi:hypothetical protein
MGNHDNRRTAKMKRKRAQKKKKALVKKRIAEKLPAKPMNRKGAVAKTATSASVRRPAE